MSTGRNGEEKLRLEVEADHQYYVERGAQGLFLKNFDNNARLLDGGPLKNLIDFTSASPEVTRELLAAPKSDGTPQNHRWRGEKNHWEHPNDNVRADVRGAVNVSEQDKLAA